MGSNIETRMREQEALAGKLTRCNNDLLKRVEKLEAAVEAQYQVWEADIKPPSESAPSL